MKQKKIGLFFGSFNPIHIGHLIIANHMVEKTDLNEVWFVVSPQNPFKEKKTLANNYDRIHLVKLAIENNPKIKASDIEFGLPVPSYTIDTLTHLKEKYTHHKFVLLMGGDNLGSLHKWKNYEKLLSDYQIYVYDRPNYELGPLASHGSVKIMEAPLLSISASFIRKSIQEGYSIQYLVPDEVFQYLEDNPIYKRLMDSIK